MSKHRDSDGLYKQPGSHYWYGSYTDASGKRVRRSTRRTVKREAKTVLAGWRDKAARAAVGPQAQEHSFEDMMVAFLRHSRETKRPSGYTRDLVATARLRESFANVPMASITRAPVKAYMERRAGEGVTPASVLRELAVLSAAFNYVRFELEWPVDNPVQGRKPIPAKGRVRWESRERIDDLIAAAREEPKAASHLPDYIRLAVNTGCRRGELLWLRWSQVDLARGVIRLTATDTKTGVSRGIPLSDDAQKVLKHRLAERDRLCPGSPWVFCHLDGQRLGERITDIKKSFAGACRRAGIEDFRIHDLRHTFASWLVMEGTPLTEVRDLLGHTTVRMTERYAHLAPDNLKSAIGRLNRGDGAHPMMRRVPRAGASASEGDEDSGGDAPMGRASADLKNAS
jgi:integrase